MSRKRPRRWRDRSPYPGNWLYLMATVDNWCMVRHAHAIPFAIPLKEWEAMPLAPDPPDRDAALPVPQRT